MCQHMWADSWDNSSFDDVLSVLIKDWIDNPFQSSHPGNFMLMDSIKNTH